MAAVDECVYTHFFAGKLQVMCSICETGRESNNNNVINSSMI